MTAVAERDEFAMHAIDIIGLIRAAREKGLSVALACGVHGLLAVCALLCKRKFNRTTQAPGQTAMRIFHTRGNDGRPSLSPVHEDACLDACASHPSGPRHC